MLKSLKKSRVNFLVCAISAAHPDVILASEILVVCLVQNLTHMMIAPGKTLGRKSLHIKGSGGHASGLSQESSFKYSRHFLPRLSSLEVETI